MRCVAEGQRLQVRADQGLVKGQDIGWRAANRDRWEMFEKRGR